MVKTDCRKPHMKKPKSNYKLIPLTPNIQTVLLCAPKKQESGLSPHTNPFHQHTEVCVDVYIHIYILNNLFVAHKCSRKYMRNLAMLATYACIALQKTNITWSKYLHNFCWLHTRELPVVYMLLLGREEMKTEGR